MRAPGAPGPLPQAGVGAGRVPQRPSVGPAAAAGAAELLRAPRHRGPRRRARALPPPPPPPAQVRPGPLCVRGGVWVRFAAKFRVRSGFCEIARLFTAEFLLTSWAMMRMRSPQVPFLGAWLDQHSEKCCQPASSGDYNDINLLSESSVEIFLRIGA